MAKYIVTSGSYFQPFSYDELARPVAQAAEIHRATQDAYDQYTTEAEALRRYIEQEPDDSNARRMYDSYMTKLSDLQNNLWSNGYNAQTRRELSAARAGYASDISRLGTAIQTRQQRSAEYWDTKHKHPDMIMGEDPGLSGLDNYLANDRFGQDYYSYSGLEFRDQVGLAAKARAKEMLKLPEILNDDRAVGYLMRIDSKGFTSSEVMVASNAVISYLAGNEGALDSLDLPEKILADVLVSNLESTGAQGKVSPEEFGRLVQYGISGLSQAIGDADVDYMKDLQWEANEKRSFERFKNSISGSGGGGNNGFGIVGDSWQRDYTGQQYNATTRQLLTFLGERGLLGRDKTWEPAISHTGEEITSDAQASSLVYGEEIRNEGRRVIGVDVGLNPDTNGIWFNRPKSFLHGQIEVDGVTYDTRYNVNTKKMEITEAGKNNWKSSKYLTEQYDYYRKQYENNLTQWEAYDPEIVKRATITPEKQEDFYSKQNIPAGTPLADVQSAAFNTADKSKHRHTYYEIARDGFDNGKYLEDISKSLPNMFKHDDKGNVVPNREWKAFNGTAHGIHKISPSGALSFEAVQNPNDIFKFDKEGNITNIERISLDFDGVANSINNEGYIIFELSDKDGEYALGLDMLDSTLLSAVFPSILNQLGAVLSTNYSDDRKEELMRDVLRGGSAGFRGTMWEKNTVGRGGTKDKNPN